MRSAVTSRSNWANDSKTLRVSRPIEVVVLNCWVTETNDCLPGQRHHHHASGTDASVNIWNLQTGKILRNYRNERGSVSAVTFSPDGQYVASASKASSILILDLANGTKRILRDVDPSEQIRHIAFSPNGKFLVGGSENGKIRIWNVSTGNVERSFAAHTAKIQGLEFNPDGTLLA
jgi:WD40 repeat protein